MRLTNLQCSSMGIVHLKGFCHKPAFEFANVDKVIVSPPPSYQPGGQPETTSLCWQGHVELAYTAANNMMDRKGNVRFAAGESTILISSRVCGKPMTLAHRTQLS